MFTLIGLAGGTFELFFGFANIWVRAGLAMFLYGWALRHIAFNRTLRTSFHISALAAIRGSWLAYVAAGCVLGVALILRRDAIGWLGLAACVVWVTSWAWNLRQAKALADVLESTAMS